MDFLFARLSVILELLTIVLFSFQVVWDFPVVLMLLFDF